MTTLDERLAALRIVLSDPRTSAEIKASVLETVTVMSQICGRVQWRLSLPLPESLAHLTQPQISAVHEFARVCVATAVEEYGRQVAIEAAAQAVAHAHRH
jgi:hypothetical protein